jgi:hypothetical protein
MVNPGAEFVRSGSSCPSWSTRRQLCFAGHITRGDFSRWIGDVFGDRALAGELRALEARYRTGSRAETISEMAAAVRG